LVDNTPRVLAGRYEVGELIGRGGMAEVHIGHDARLGRTVAIKVLRSDLARDPSFLARFRREAQAAAALNHPAIVAVYDTGEDVHTDPVTGQQQHVPFIVMEYVEGHTVRDILQDGAAVPIEEAVEITVGVLSALEYSHHAGIVHRDIKPANVMITPTGAVKVMDFGIARAVADSAATMTATHAVIGTAQYLSPEQARGEQVDARSDLYSTGCLLFELLTGRPPFIGDSPVAVAYQHVGQAPQRPSEIASDVPEVLDRITLKALAKERGSRYSSAAEFRADLDAAMRGGAIAAPGIGAGLAAAGAVAGAATTVAFGAPGLADGATQILTPEVAATQPWGATGLPVGAGGPGTDPTVAGGTAQPAKKKSRKGLIWGLVAGGVVLVAAIIFAISLLSQPPEVKLVEVPEITSTMTQEQAKEVVEKAGFEFRFAIDEDSNDPQGTFVRQDPAAGEKRREGSVVTAFFAGAPNTLGVPDVTGKTVEEARQMLTDAGLVVGTQTPESSADVPKDSVTRTDPPAGQFATTGDTVNLFVSDGTVDLPDLTGKTRDEADSILSDLDLRPSWNQEPSDTVPVGSVVRQTPAPGAVEQKSTVNIWLATEPEVEQVPVPDIVGQEWNEQTQAKCAGLNCLWEYANSDTVPLGSVISTNPTAGTMLDVGSTVTVTISKGGATPPANNNSTASPSTPPAED
jgi:serine/threonine-protein kinase